MKVKVGDKTYDGKDEPVMVILSQGEKDQIANMHPDGTKFCIYPDKEKWIKNKYAGIKKWMADTDEERVQIKKGEQINGGEDGR